MIYALGFYWIVAGITMFSIGVDGYPTLDNTDIVISFLIALLFGGFILPVRLLLKVVR